MCKPPILWVVVKVESGIPVLAEVFGDEAMAWQREDELRTEMRPDNDAV